MGLVDCKLIELPKIVDPRGNLTFVENLKHVPFEIRRVFYIYNVPNRVSRGGHAHKNLHQFLICLNGSLDVELDDGSQKNTIHLNKPWVGLYIPPRIWAIETNFDSGTVCLVLTSDFYDENDYYRDYAKFLNATQDKTT